MATRTSPNGRLNMDRVGVEDAKALEYVDDTKYYKVALQLGARRRWRHCNGGAWKYDPNNSNDTEKAYKHHPAIHEVGPLSGAIVNGLISNHNKFVKANRNRDSLEGDVGRMLIVLDTQETAPPELKRAALPFDLEPMIARIAEQVAVKTVEAVLKSK